MTSTHVEPRLISVAEFDAMSDAHVFGTDKRAAHIELVGGRLYESAPLNDPHVIAIRRLTTAFAHMASGGRLLVQLPVVISNFDEPEPDLAVLRPDYPFTSGKPTASDLDLVIEVSDASRVDYDYAVKRPAYLAAGVTEVWIVNLVKRRIDVFVQGMTVEIRMPFSIAHGPFLRNCKVRYEADLTDLFEEPL